ncbi:hypothetical protein AGMMS49579_01020 [Spirochaetia bacterium]|nr:hypothetical protein AGMMS49579_01020 [Spirochaetia bacterium]
MTDFNVENLLRRSGSNVPLGPNSVNTSNLVDGSVTNSKLANLPGPSQLLGSSSASSNPTNITLGNGLTMNGNVLSVTGGGTTQKAGTSQFGVVEFAASGDLVDASGPTANSGIAVIKPGAITYAKLQPLSQPALLGSATAGGNASEVTLQPVFSLNNNSLALTPTFNIPGPQRTNGTSFSLNRNAYVSYVVKNVPYTQSIDFSLSSNGTVISEYSLGLPSSGGTSTETFTVQGFVPAGATILLTLVTDGVNQTSAVTSSEEVLF